MTNSYDVDHGLSQCPPGPLEPVEIAQQPGAAPATGNTARDQEMYVAGIRTGEENAKHNAAIRGCAGWLPIESAPKDGRRVLLWNERYNAAITGQFYGLVGWKLDGEMPPLFHQPTHWMPLPAAPGSTSSAPGDAQKVYHFEQRSRFGPWIEVEKPTAKSVEFVKRSDAPAAGDALDAARLDWLEQHDGRFYNKDRISSIVGTGFLVAGDEQGARHQTVRAAVDAAIAAQRKGDA